MSGGNLQDLADMILALKIVSGLLAERLGVSFHVDADDKVGLAEVICGRRPIAGN